MNPFRVLEIPVDADQQQIVKAAALALQKKAFSAFEVATAQKQLLDPAGRAELAFLYAIDFDALLDKPDKRSIDPGRDEKPRLQRLKIFDR